MAVASDPRRHRHRQLPRAAQALEAIQQASLEAILRSIPGLRMPDHWPRRYADLEPLSVSGEPVSEQLIRERR